MSIKKHKSNDQPVSTRGKVVQYLTYNIYDEKGSLVAPGFWHHKAPADELNWKRNGLGAAQIGCIDSYIIA